MIEQQPLAQTDILARLKMAGIIANVPGDLPLQNTLVVADALLAAPVLAVEVALVNEDTAVIQDLVTRANGLITVGARVDSIVQVTAALTSGADFITTDQWDTAVWQLCQRDHVLYIPGALSATTITGIQKRGCEVVRLKTGGPQGVAYAAMVCHQFPKMFLTIEADIAPDNIGDYAQAGAAAIFVGDAIYQNRSQTMAQIITRARSLQKGWESHEDGTN